MNQRRTVMMLIIVIGLLVGSMPSYAQDTKPTDSLSLNFTSIIAGFTDRQVGNRTLSITDMQGAADGITTSVEVVDYLSDGTARTNNIIGVLIALNQNNRVVWRFTNIQVNGEAATPEQTRTISRVFLRAWNGYLREQIGPGRRITETVNHDESITIGLD